MSNHGCDEHIYKKEWWKIIAVLWQFRIKTLMVCEIIRWQMQNSCILDVEFKMHMERSSELLHYFIVLWTIDLVLDWAHFTGSHWGKAF